jgi:heme-degrading monooxygenase HmoA
MTRIVILRVRIAPDRANEFEAMIAGRASHHKKTRGFERMYLLRGEVPQEYRLVTWWKELGDPKAFVRSESYALSEDRAHAGIVVGPVAHEVLEIVQQF